MGRLQLAQSSSSNSHSPFLGVQPGLPSSGQVAYFGLLWVTSPIRAVFLSLVVTEPYDSFSAIFLIGVGLLGATAGAHRLWTHRSYTANTFLRFLLVMCHTIGGTGTIYDWVLDHRIHHQYESTEDDPFNKERGFLYAHLGQKLRHGSPKREELIHEIDMTDIESDKIVMFQKRWIEL